MKYDILNTPLWRVIAHYDVPDDLKSELHSMGEMLRQSNSNAVWHDIHLIIRDVREKLHSILKRHGICFNGICLDESSLEVRYPGYAIDSNDSAAYGWHRDGTSKADIGPQWIAIWASSEPTPLRPLRRVWSPQLPEHYRVQPEPPPQPEAGDIVLVNNRNVQHRHPPVISPGRLFARLFNPRVS